MVTPEWGRRTGMAAGPACADAPARRVAAVAPPIGCEEGGPTMLRSVRLTMR
jgi:hypothetical protein